MKEIEALTPNGGAYMNEADFQQPNFQKEFFGSNYNSLLCLKQKWDPEGFFYVRNAVGSESWSVASNGRMCRV
ncbi:isoamyl alcohol oxidase [Colletotrichum tofieldiae]|nr:isoamyl alcohol oxidase [Colletotrichum tofieldiae]